jgi:hypothetical protein
MTASGASDAQAIYADPAFIVFSEAVREIVARRRVGNWVGAATTLAKSAPVVARGMRVILRAPQLTLTLNEGPAGRAIAAERGIARAILVLPSSIEEYLKGRSRQAVRTNTRRARESGVTCREVPLADQAEVIATFLHIGGWDHDDATRLDEVLGVRPGEQRFFVAELDGSPLAIGAIEVDDRSALLKFQHSVPHAELASPARYALTVCIIEALIASRVTTLLVGTTVRLDAGLQYFQRRLGFGIWHVRTRFRPAPAVSALPAPRTGTNRVDRPGVERPPANPATSDLAGTPVTGTPVTETRVTGMRCADTRTEVLPALPAVPVISPLAELDELPDPDLPTAGAGCAR